MIRGARSLGPPIPAELLAIPDELMPETDGQPMDSDWHRLCMCLLLEVVTCRFQGHDDYYVSGNSCIYYSEEQVLKRDFLGPDFFFVKNVDRLPKRTRWIVWREGMRFPNAIIELLSESTAKEDLGPKKHTYEKVFKTSEYFCYDPDTEVLGGWRLDKKGNYQSLSANDRGWLWSAQLEMWLGTWRGKYQEYEGLWLRFYDKEGKLVPVAAEQAGQKADAQQKRAKAERKRAEAERKRAEAAEAELARLKAQLAAQRKNGSKSRNS
jgi:Uma2 family endonuclease